MKKSSKKMALLSTIAITLVSCISISFAWFIFSDSVSVQSQNSAGVKAGSYMQIAYKKENNTWSTWGDEFVFTTPTMADITGDGVNFAVPYTLNGQDQPLFPLLELTSATRSGYYIEYYLKIRTDQEFGLYLSSNSYVKPHGSVDANTEDGTNKSIFGNFSANYIAGAARVSISEVINSTEYLRQLWIPNELYTLKYIDDVAYFYLSGNGTAREEKYGYLVNEFEQGSTTRGQLVHKYYTDKDYICKNITVGDSLANMEDGLQNNGPLLTTFTGQGVYKEKQIVVRMWIEGTDRESNSAFNQGICDFYLEFCGIKKDAETTSDINFVKSLKTIDQDSNAAILGVPNNNNVLTQLNSTSPAVQFSYDGRDWFDYDYQTGLTKYYRRDVYPNYYPDNKQETVYLRLKESVGRTNLYTIEYNMKTRTYKQICPDLGED